MKHWQRTLVVCGAWPLLVGLCPSIGMAETAGSGALALAREAYADGLYGVAEMRAREVLAQSTNAVVRGEAIPVLLESLATLSRTNALAEALLNGMVPEGADALLYWQGRLALVKGDGDGALKLLNGFSERYPKSTLLADVLNVRVLAALATGDVSGAMADMARFDEACEDALRKQRNRLDWGRALLASGDAAGAAEILEPLIADEGSHGYMARYWSARAKLQIPEKADASVKELAVLSLEPRVPMVLRAGAALAVADAALISGNATGSVSVLKSCLGWFPEGESVLRTEITRDLASSLLALDRVDEAAEWVRKVVAADSESVVSGQLLLELAARQLQGGAAEAARASYQSYLETFAFPEGEAVATAGRAAALMKLGKFAHAASDFERAAALFKEEGRRQSSILQAGEALVANDQSGLAASHFRRIVEEWPECVHVPRALFLLGVGCATRGEHEQADRYFERVSKTYPDVPEAEAALLQIALIHEGLRDWKGAEAAFDAQLARYPAGRFAARGVYGRGRARYEAGLPGALEDLAAAEQLGGTGSVVEKAVFLRAMCLYRLGRDAEALSVCEGYGERFPGSAWAPRVQYWVGTFLFNGGRHEDAETQFLRFVELFPEDALADDALLRAGLSALNHHAFVRANEHFGALAKRYPESERLAEARFRQGEALSELGEFSAAILAFDEVINEFPNSVFIGSAWGRKGDCQFMLGATEPARYEEGLSSYRVVTQIPDMRLADVLEAEYKMGRCLQKQGQEAASLNQYYSRVMVPFLDAQAQGATVTGSAKLWFTRAADKAADYLEAEGQWRQMGRVLEHVAAAGVSASAEAAKRAQTIRQEHWWDFL